MDNWSEPAITINGQTLTTAQAMTVRVALGNFAIDLHGDHPLGGDETGRAIASGYKRCIGEIHRIMNQSYPT